MENVREQFRTSENILIILSSIENSKINIWYNSVHFNQQYWFAS